MLRELTIRNLAVVEAVTVEFGRGFHVLTGETGAGKSILIDALSLLAGGRSDADLVRHGCQKAEMEAQFDLPESHPVWSALTKIGVPAQSDESLIVRREISSSGKSTSRINGHLVTQSMLRDIGEKLINIHGQHEHQALLRTEQHLEWLDQYGGPSLLSVRSNYRKLYHEWKEAVSVIRDLEGSARQDAQMLDLYLFQINEISAAHLVDGEEEALASQKQMLQHSTNRLDAVTAAYSLLSDQGTLDSISKAIMKLTDIVPYDSEKLSPLLEQLQGAYYQAEDAAFQLRDYRDHVEADPEQLSSIEDRLDTIKRLKKKYGATVKDILEHLAHIKAESEKFVNRDQLLQQGYEKQAELLQKAMECAHSLSEQRKQAADRLSSAVGKELQQLQMGAAKFAVEVAVIEANAVKPLNANGMDEVAFLLSANPGEPLKPLSKIASGGEMSRIMLALKSIFHDIDQVPILIFDEVDTGISGRAAQAVAEKMVELSKSCQVCSITHLPQVACMADQHFEISKQINQERTSTAVVKLAREARIQELARMLGGVEITDRTRNHAQEMLELAGAQKAYAR